MICLNRFKKNQRRRKTHACGWLASPRLHAKYFIRHLTRHRLELYPIDIARTIGRRDPRSFGSNDECIRITLGRPSRGEVKLGGEGAGVIDEIVIADKGSVKLGEELVYQVRV